MSKLFTYEELTPEEQKEFDKDIKEHFEKQKPVNVVYLDSCHRDIETYFDRCSEHYMGNP